jgi:hypothetical protein
MGNSKTRTQKAGRKEVEGKGGGNFLIKDFKFAA